MAVRWYDPLTRQVTMSGRSGTLRQVLDGQEVPYVARPFKTILISGQYASPMGHCALAQLFDLNITSMKAVLERLVTLDGPVKEVKVVGDDVDFVAVIDGRTRRPESLHCCSAGLKTIFLCEVAAAHAAFHASVEPTLLLLDEPETGLHAQATAALVERLDQTCGQAQIAIVTHAPAALAARPDWNVLTLGDSRGGARPVSSPIDLTIESRGGLEGVASKG